MPGILGNESPPQLLKLRQADCSNDLLDFSRLVAGGSYQSCYSFRTEPLLSESAEPASTYQPLAQEKHGSSALGRVKANSS
jgi:hypothetical protein